MPRAAAPAVGGREIQPQEFVYDAQADELRWVLPEAGYVRLRIGVEGFPHLGTLKDWEWMAAGSHALKWDGHDPSGWVNLEAHPHRDIKLTVFAPDRQAAPGYLHGRHAREVCHEARLQVTFPEAARHDARGWPIVAGVVPVRVTLDPYDAPHWVNTRYEVALFVDLVALFEEEESTNPYTYLWDTRGLNPGEHLLTVNVLSYDDHFGVATVPVIIAAGEAGAS